MGNAGFWKSGWLLVAVVAAGLLAVACLQVVLRRFLSGGRSDKSAPLAPDFRRQHALACQGQGQLDEAFEAFRQCPMDAVLCDSLYGLALDYEAQRQFDKAVVVYRYIAEADPEFRDLPRRLARLRQLSEGEAGRAQLSVAQGGETAQPVSVGPYRIDRGLGRGAMGVVYLGHDPARNRSVAIKTVDLAREFAPDRVAEAKARLLHEAETAERLMHPDIVTIYEAGQDGALTYIAMEFVDGDDLVPYTRDGHLLPLATVLAIGVRVAAALDYAHRRQVVHRDIKPANILFSPESGQVKVTDFGIAGITDGCLTRKGAILGTPAFMSPEQLAGKPIDGRSDLYSLGVTLFQLCSGQVPFVGESVAQMMYNIAHEPAPLLSDVNTCLPPPLAAVIARCLAKDPEQRYQHGMELADDLRACIDAGAGTMAPLPGIPPSRDETR